MVTSSPMNKAPKQVQQQQQNMHQKQQQWTPQRPQKSRSNGSTHSSSSSHSSTPNGKNSSSSRSAVKRVNSSPVAAHAQGGGGQQHQPLQQLNWQQQHYQQQQQQQQHHQQFRTPTKNIPVRKHSCSTPRASPARASQTPSPRAFAGSKCYEPPTAQSLPKPPSTWMQMAKSSPAVTIQSSTPAADDAVSQHLKLLLNVQN